MGPRRIGYTKPGVGAGNGEFWGVRFGAKQASYRGMGFPDFFLFFFCSSCSSCYSCCSSYGRSFQTEIRLLESKNDSGSCVARKITKIFFSDFFLPFSRQYCRSLKIRKGISGRSPGDLAALGCWIKGLVWFGETQLNASFGPRLVCGDTKLLRAAPARRPSGSAGPRTWPRCSHLCGRRTTAGNPNQR